MSANTEKDRPDPFSSATPPVRLMVRCPACGYERATLALHADAVRRARICERCGAVNELAEVSPVHGLGCSCCT